MDFWGKSDWKIFRKKFCQSLFFKKNFFKSNLFSYQGYVMCTRAVTGYWVATGNFQWALDPTSEHWALLVGYWTVLLGYCAVLLGHWAILLGHYALLLGHWALLLSH